MNLESVHGVSGCEGFRAPQQQLLSYVDIRYKTRLIIRGSIPKYYNRGMSFKVLFCKPPQWHYYRQTILNQLNIMLPYVDIICFNFMRNLCDAA